jgi:hypothetical protein
MYRACGGRKLMSEQNKLSLGEFVCFRTYFAAFRSNINDTLLIVVSDAARPVRSPGDSPSASLALIG